MDNPTPCLPHEIFSSAGVPAGAQPRVFIAPQRYIQGKDVLAQMGRYLSLVPAHRAAILISARGQRRHGDLLQASLRESGIDPVFCTFNGECSLDEIQHHVQALKGQGVDCVLAVGGGKCIDTGKAAAFRLDLPVVVAPTLASTDAPCSAVSVLYTPEGVTASAEFYPCSPVLVVVDTGIIAEASERFLVAGMGDAMATWYEASACQRNPAAVTMIGARPTLAAWAIGDVCARTLFREGIAAAAAVAESTVNESLEAVVEANTLLSGLGFESGGLAAAHAFARSFTRIPQTNANYLHGEMVAMGTLAQLVMECRPDEVHRVAEFFATVGLPVHLGQLSISADDSAMIDSIIEGTLAVPFLRNMPGEVEAESLRKALLVAHELGLAMTRQVGDAAYRRLHAD